jgi:hypothetical protein
MHPAVSYELAKAGVTDLRHQTQRDASARNGRRARRTPARPNVDDARRCSPPACSDRMRPGVGVVAEAIRATVQKVGARGCIGRIAQEFGDHPEAATERMRWVRPLLSPA